MEPPRQVEVQLGHLCNNRCVFCVSGQQTERRQALPVAAAPVVERLREARARGNSRLTLLGGEPTLQPEFTTVLREAVALGFDEIVLFTNGAKTARPEYLDELLAIAAPRLRWRLSFQGATALAHERTTRKLGSFARLVRTLEGLRERRQHVTVNLCVVRSNYESLGAFAALLLPYGVRQLHVDMVRPRDAGERSDDELRAMLPRLDALAGPLEAMVRGFPEGFDVNIGNLPFCAAPSLAPWIHHDGEHTETVAVDGRDALSDPWDKYENKRRDKVKAPTCERCVFDARCGGVYEAYARFYGLDELRPVSHEALVRLDPRRRLFALHLAPALRAALAPGALGAWAAREVRSDDVGSVLRCEGAGGARVDVLVGRPTREATVRAEGFSLTVLGAQGPYGALLRSLAERLCAAAPALGAVLAPAVERATSGRRAALDAALLRLHRAAPFGALRWRSCEVDDEGARLRFALEAAAGEPERSVDVRLTARGTEVRWGYRTDAALEGEGVARVREGLAALVAALRSDELSAPRA